MSILRSYADPPIRSFTAIAANLVGAPALVGNVLVWKPSPGATYASWLVFNILLEAGLPKNVIQFLPCPNGDATISLVDKVLSHRMFAGLHFTGSTHVFRSLWKQIGNNIDRYLSYPRVVGETGGKNFQLVHPSADLRAAVIGAIRGAFEYQGKSSALMASLWTVANSVLTRLHLYRPEVLCSLSVVRSQVALGGPGQVQGDAPRRGRKDHCRPRHRVRPLHGPGHVSCSMRSKVTETRETDLLEFVPRTHSSQGSYDKCLSYVEKAKQAGGEVLAGGVGDNSTGYFVQPTVILTKDPRSPTMVDEIFGPVLTVYIYEDDQFEEICKLIDETTTYALTGCIFSNDRAATVKAGSLLRFAAGNYYINDKCTGAYVAFSLSLCGGCLAFLPKVARNGHSGSGTGLRASALCSVDSQLSKTPTDLRILGSPQRRWPATVWWGSRFGHERQSRLDFDLLPLCQRPGNQGDVYSSDGLCVPVKLELERRRRLVDARASVMKKG
jgi:1-pyrroline-5-carboxylate dehydrogenase